MNRIVVSSFNSLAGGFAEASKQQCLTINYLLANVAHRPDVFAVFLFDGLEFRKNVWKLIWQICSKKAGYMISGINKPHLPFVWIFHRQRFLADPVAECDFKFKSSVRVAASYLRRAGALTLRAAEELGKTVMTQSSL
jgi:hypothetical protein